MTKIKLIRTISNYFFLSILFLIIGLFFLIVSIPVLFRATLFWIQSEDSFIQEIKNAYKDV